MRRAAITKRFVPRLKSFSLIVSFMRPSAIAIFFVS